MAVQYAGTAKPFLELDGEAYVSVLATWPFYELAAAVGGISAVFDLPVEWQGSYDLILTWDEIQRLIDQLTLTWVEIAQAGIVHGTLPITWNERNALVGLDLTWVELPTGLLPAYELDPQRPYGRVIKNP